LIAYQAAEPIIVELLRRGKVLTVYSSDAALPIIEKRLKNFQVQLVDYSLLLNHQRWLRFLVELILVLVTDLNYSHGYKHRYWSKWRNHHSLVVKSFAIISKFFPKCNNGKVNQLIRSLLSPLAKNPFSGKHVLVVSRINAGHTLLNVNLDITTLMESWDHPPKAPLGYVSNTVYVWNTALQSQWRYYQGDTDVRIGYPFKLDYVFKRKLKKVKVDDCERPKFVIYPASYSSFSESAFFEDECTVLNHICSIADKYDVCVYIKPKPNGPIGDFDQFAAKYKNVILGKEKGSADPVSYFLDDVYNESRIALLNRSDLVLNIGTTFALDAAVFGIPVAQLVFKGAKTFDGLAKNFEYEHLDLFSDNCRSILNIQDEDSLQVNLNNVFSGDWKDQSVQFSEQLRSWFDSKLTSDVCITAIVDRIVQAEFFSELGHG
jgi:hypothetical protein